MPKLAVRPGAVFVRSSHKTFWSSPFSCQPHYPRGSSQTLPTFPLRHNLRKLLNESQLFTVSSNTSSPHCCQSNLSTTKSGCVTSLFRIFVSRIQWKSLPRAYEVLYFLPSNYLPCSSHTRQTKQAGSSWTVLLCLARSQFLSWIHMANAYSFLEQLKPQSSPCFFSRLASHFTPLPMVILA